MGAVTALNTLSVFEYDQLGNGNPVINQGVNLQEQCMFCPSIGIAAIELPLGAICRQSRSLISAQSVSQ
jgi:hypothetical protein